MIIDRNEAFKHNSCKKLAQLGKVIFTLTANERDKEDEKSRISQEYETSISALFEKHSKQVDEIRTNLVRYRKSCIDKSCSEFGNHYKQLKTDYSDLISKQTTKLQTIMSELKQAKESLNEMERNTAAQVKNVVTCADTFFNETKAKYNDSRGNQRKDVQEAIAPITEKTEALLADFERRLKALKTSHNSEAKKIKNEINKLFKGAITNRKDELVVLYKKAFSLKSEIGSTRKEYIALIEQHQKQAKSLLESRNAVLQGIKHGCHDIKKQKENLAIQESKNAKLRQSEIADLTRNLKISRNSQKSELEKIDQNIMEKKNQIQKLVGRNSSNSKSRNSALNSITEGIIRDFEEEMTKKKFEHDRIASEIADIHIENNDLSKWTEKSVSENIERINNKMIAFKYKSDQNDKIRSVSFEKEIEEIKKHLSEKINILHNVIESQMVQKEAQHIKEKEVVEKSQIELNDLLEKQHKEFDEKQIKINKEIEDYRVSTKARQVQRIKELDMSKSRRFKDKQKKLDDLLEKNKSEIQTKVNQMRKDKEDEIGKLRETANDDSTNTKEMNNFTQKKSQLESMNQFISKQIDDKKNDIEKANQKFQNDLSAVDKLKRQLQRRIEAETRTVDDEFEMKIQVCQVDLQKAIENISKLYDEDENQRGREVIEAIRKVRETKNKNSDFLSRKNKELLDLKNRNQDEETELNSNLERIQMGDKEFQLKKEFEIFQKKTEEMIQEIHTAKRTQIQAINDTLAKMSTEHEKNVKKLQNEIKQSEESFLENSKNIEKEIDSIGRLKEEIFAKTTAKFNTKETEVMRKHSIEVEKMNRRIDQAKARFEEIEEGTKKQDEEQLKKWEESTEAEHSKMWNTIQDNMQQMNKKNEELEEQIKKLWDKEAEIEKSVVDPPQRKEEQQKIAELQTEISNKSTEIQLKFENLFSLFENGPDQGLVKSSSTRSSGLLKSTRSRGKIKTLGSSSNLQSLPPLEGM